MAQIALASLAAAILGAALARRIGSAAAAVLAVVAASVASGSGRYELSVAQTEALYLILLCGLSALLLLQPRIDRSWPWLCAGVAAGLLLRSSAVAVLGAVLLVGLLAWRRGRLRPLALFGGLGLSLGAVAAIGIGFNLLVNGRMAMPQWGGMSVLGRALVALPDPPPAAFPPAAEPVLPMIRAAQAHLDAAPGLLLRVRLAEGQADALRFAWFWPTVSGVPWPNRPLDDLFEWGRLGGRIATEVMQANPQGILRMAAYSYIGFWTQPRLLTPWTRGADLAWLAQNPIPGQAQVPWPIVDFSRGDDAGARLRALPVPFLLIGAGLAGAVVLLLAARALLVRSAWTPPDDLVFAAAALHGTALVVAATEFGLFRYALPLLPLCGHILVRSAALVLRARAPARAKAVLTGS